MILTFGHGQAYKNILRVLISDPHKQGFQHSDGINSIKENFKEFLKIHQPKCPPNFGNELITGDQSPEDNNDYLKFGESRIDDLYQENIIGEKYSSKEFLNYRKTAEDALEHISSLSGVSREIFDLYINEVSLRESNHSRDGRKAFGGSTSKTIGKIWLAPSAKLGVRDYVELLIHELTHNMLFVDELNHRHFEYSNMHKEPYFAQSAILNSRRPLDKVFHSIFVGLEVWLWRQARLGWEQVVVHPDSDTLLVQIKDSIASIFGNEKTTSLLLPRARSLLETASEILERPDQHLATIS